MWGGSRGEKMRMVAFPATAEMPWRTVNLTMGKATCALPSKAEWNAET